MMIEDISSEYTQLYSIDQGKGPPILLIHGVAASHHDWDGMLPLLVGAGFHPYAVDLLGHGDSPKPKAEKYYHAQSLYHALEVWIEHLALEQAPMLVGHSLGGYLALRYALAHPEQLCGLALVSPLYSHEQFSPLTRLVQRRPLVSARAMQAIPNWLVEAAIRMAPASSFGFSEQLIRQNAEDMRRASPHVLHTPFTIRNLKHNLPEVTVPALVVWGGKDMTLLPASFHQLADALSSAQAHSFPGCGHQPHITQAERVAQMLINFYQHCSVRS